MNTDNQPENTRDEEQVRQRCAEFRDRFAALRDEIGKVIVGNQSLVEDVLIALFSGGHVLLEGVPGLGKTLLVRTLASALNLKFSRIQFTPDLMPADILGTNIVIEDPATGRRQFEFQSGPIFAQVLLADEINRATPKTQSAMLEAMQEHSVTIARQRFDLEEPFLVLATQNPIEQEGTYPLPEAQLDRFFFKLLVEYSSREEMATILERTTTGHRPDVSAVLTGAQILEMQQLVRETRVAAHVEDFAIRLVLATHPEGEFATEETNRFVQVGSSPRGAQALALAAKVRALLDGRYNVAFDDVAASCLPALRHRMLLNFEGEAEGLNTDDLLSRILEQTPREMQVVA